MVLSELYDDRFFTHKKRNNDCLHSLLMLRVEVAQICLAIWTLVRSFEKVGSLSIHLERVATEVIPERDIKTLALNSIQS